MLSHHERTNMAISRSGLPKTVLELFDPRADLEYKAPLEPKKPALPLLGLAGYTGHFPGPDDPEYQPSRAEVAQAEERKFRSKEYHLQVAIEVPSIDERCGAFKMAQCCMAGSANLAQQCANQWRSVHALPYAHRTPPCAKTLSLRACARSELLAPPELFGWSLLQTALCAARPCLAPCWPTHTHTHKVCDRPTRAGALQRQRRASSATRSSSKLPSPRTTPRPTPSPARPTP